MRELFKNKLTYSTLWSKHVCIVSANEYIRQHIGVFSVYLKSGIARITSIIIFSSLSERASMNSPVSSSRRRNDGGKIWHTPRSTKPIRSHFHGESRDTHRSIRDSRNSTRNLRLEALGCVCQSFLRNVWSLVANAENAENYERLLIVAVYLTYRLDPQRQRFNISPLQLFCSSDKKWWKLVKRIRMFLKTQE